MQFIGYLFIRRLLQEWLFEFLLRAVSDNTCAHAPYIQPLDEVLGVPTYCLDVGKCLNYGATQLVIESDIKKRHARLTSLMQ